MDAAKCRLCGKKEWSHRCNGTVDRDVVHVVKEPATRIDTLPTRQAAPVPRASISHAPDEPLAKKTIEATVKPKRNRKEYMREFMRRQRAKQKESGDEEVRTL